MFPARFSAKSSRLIVLSVFAAMGLHAAAKKITGSGRGENDDVILNVTIYADSASIKEALGDDLGGHYIVAQVKVSPKYTKEISIDRDAFALRTDKDGDRTKPMAPSQIAGGGSLVLTGVQGPGGLGAERSRGWSIGGMGVGGGNGAAPDPANVTAKMEDAEKDNPLKKLLDEKVLPEKKVEEPVSGFLYFPMENQKLKDLELVYGPRQNQIRVRFK
ncbi:MAG: hypothetical protein ABI759_24820 [Candidatus Solibacter sp.]